MKKLLSIIFVFFLLFSCKSKRQDSSGMLIHKVYEFDIVGRFINLINFEMTLNTDSSYNLFFQNFTTKKIIPIIINENSAKAISNKKININGYFFSLFFHSTDSIFSFINETNQISLKNSLGSVLHTYHINEEYTPVASPIIKLTGSNRRLLLGNTSKSINFGKYKQRKIFYNSIKPLMIVDFSDSIPKCYSFSKFPNKYIDSGDNFYDVNPSACFGNDGLICVSFGSDDYLYLYSDSTLVLKKKVKSKYINKFNSYPDSKIFDMLFYKNYILEEPKYTDIIYDPWNNLYYRVVKHRFNKEKIIKNTWSVIVTDDKLNVIYEKLFDYRYNPNIFVPTPYGILLENKSRSSHTKTVFEVVKFSKT